MVGTPSTKSSLRAASNNGSVGNDFPNFHCCLLLLTQTKCQIAGLDLAPRWPSHVTGVQSEVSVEEMRVAKGVECSRGEGDVWCAAGGAKKGIAPLTDFVYVGMRVSV